MLKVLICLTLFAAIAGAALGINAERLGLAPAPVPAIDGKLVQLLPPPPELVTTERQPLEFPSIQQSKQATSNQLPETLEFLIIPLSQHAIVENLVFANNNKGYRVTYFVADKDLMSLHRSMSLLLSQNNFKVLFGSRTATSGSIDAEGGIYKIKISEEVEGSGILMSIVTQSYE